MRRPEQTSRTLRRQQRSETRNFLLLLLIIVGVVAVVQVMLFLTMTRIRAENGNILNRIHQAPDTIGSPSTSS
ncbi:MAG TPA: hypothetical protein VKU80_05935 [Planctomycetota bacterium]|nr:hypothetical protein [Planctomycetota bacterium]